MKYCAIILFFILIAVIPATAQTDQYGRWINGFTEPWMFDSKDYSKEDAVTFQNRWRQLEGSEKAQTDEWAGFYSVGAETRLFVFRWSPDQGFVFGSVDTCRPNVDYISYGKVRVSTKFLEIDPEVNNPTTRYTGKAALRYTELRTRYLKVKWGDLHYLVPEDKIALFCDYVSGRGGYGRFGPMNGENYFWQKREDGDLFGMPVLPPGYDRYVKRPIEPSIVAFGPKVIKRTRVNGGPFYYESIIHVRLNLGTRSGLRRGMELYIVDDDCGEYVEITHVDGRASSGVIRRVLDDDRKERYHDWPSDEWKPYPKIRVGQKLTTSFFFSGL